MSICILYSGIKKVNKNYIYLTDDNKLNNIIVLQGKNKYNIDDINIKNINKIYTLSNYEDNHLLKEKIKNNKIKIIDKYIEKLRTIKNNCDIKKIKYVTELTCEAINYIKKNINKYKNENEIIIIIKNILSKYGIYEEAFPLICVNGRNNIELHYNRNDNLLKDGNVLILDIGFYYKNYCCDVALTIPINGKFNEKQQLLYNMLINISNYAIKIIKIGMLFKDWENIVFNKYIDYLYELKFINKKDIKLMKLFMPHKLGHSIGLIVHDIQFNEFKNNVTFTIEPGIYFIDKLYDNINVNKSIINEYYDIGGMRIEDMATLTNNKVIILSKNLHK
jgi:Xaa-Pro aminopeptidase